MLSFHCITVKPVFRDHPSEVTKVVSYSRWSLNTGSFKLIEEGGIVSEQWSLKAVDCSIQVVSNTG